MLTLISFSWLYPVQGSLDLFKRANLKTFLNLGLGMSRLLLFCVSSSNSCFIGRFKLYTGARNIRFYSLGSKHVLLWVHMPGMFVMALSYFFLALQTYLALHNTTTFFCRLYTRKTFYRLRHLRLVTFKIQCSVARCWYVSQQARRCAERESGDNKGGLQIILWP